MGQSRTLVPRGQVVIPPEVCEQLKGIYQLKGGVSSFVKQAGIKSDTLRLAMKRGTTTDRTLGRIKSALEKPNFPVLANKTRIDLSRMATGNGHAESVVEQIDQLPPAVLRHVQRVSSALLDGMQLMQLTMLKALQDGFAEGQGIPPRQTMKTR